MFTTSFSLTFAYAHCRQQEIQRKLGQTFHPIGFKFIWKKR